VRRDRRTAGPCSPRRAVCATGLLFLPWPPYAGGAEDGTLAQPGLSHSGAQERPGQVAAAFRAACVSGDALLLEGLWRDLRGLATRTEIEEWDSRPTITRCALLVDLVAQRAFRAGIPVEERLEQHYERLARARSDWGLSSPRVQTGAAELYGRHPDLEFGDRGLAYLRMGEPDEVAFAYAGVEGDMEDRVEGWRYDDPGGPRVFLSPVTRLGVGLRDYRLLDALWRAMGHGNAAEPIDFTMGMPTAPLRNLYLFFQGLDRHTPRWRIERRRGPEPAC